LLPAVISIITIIIFAIADEVAGNGCILLPDELFVNVAAPV